MLKQACELMRPTLFALMLGLVSNASGNWSGTEFYGNATSDSASDKRAALAYLQGVLDTEDFYQLYDAARALDFKTGKSVKFEWLHFCFGSAKDKLAQLSDVVVKYMKDHPETRYIDAHILIRSALAEAFPCANNPDPSTK